MMYIVEFTKVNWEIGSRSEQFYAEPLFSREKSVPIVF